MRLEIILSPKDLSKLVHILEASENLAVLKTIDGKNGRAELIFPSANEAVLKEFLSDIQNEHSLTIYNI